MAAALNTPASLESFFLYNPTLQVNEDTEPEKLLFYYPATTPLHKQCQAVGLTQGLVSFTQMFSDKHPADAVHFRKRRQSILEVEPNFWLVLSLHNPTHTPSGSSAPVPDEDELQDEWLRQLLEQAYRSYKCFHGCLAPLLAQQGADAVRSTTGTFFQSYLATLSLTSTTLVDHLEGISFLPVDKHSYLTLASFVQKIEMTFTDIVAGCLFYHDQLLWSGLGQEHLRVLYRYLFGARAVADPAAPGAAPEAGAGTAPSAVASSSSSSSSSTSSVASPAAGAGAFRLGATALDRKDAPISAIPIFVPAQPTDVPLTQVPLAAVNRLVVYERSDVVLVFVVAAAAAESHSWYKQLAHYIGQHIDMVIPLLRAATTAASRASDAVEEHYRYLYYNRMNFALKTSLRSRAPNARDVMRVLSQLHSDMGKPAVGEADDVARAHEVLVRTANDGWIVARRSDQRELYLIVEEKNTNLMEVSEAIQRLSQAQFQNIFHV